MLCYVDSAFLKWRKQHLALFGQRIVCAKGVFRSLLGYKIGLSAVVWHGLVPQHGSYLLD